MAQTAVDVLEQELLWAQDRILYHAITELSENLDGFPVVGLGLGFMQRSAERAMIGRVKDRFVPDMQEHLEVNLGYVAEAAAADDRDRVRDTFRDPLLETDPLWRILAADADRDQVRAELLEQKFTVLDAAVEWVAAAPGSVASIIDLFTASDRDVETALEELSAVFFYIDMMQDRRGDLDPSTYSGLLGQDAVRDWFLDHLLDGLADGRAAVIETYRHWLTEEIDAEADRTWYLLNPPHPG